jgi:hypothetical protein
VVRQTLEDMMRERGANAQFVVGGRVAETNRATVESLGARLVTSAAHWEALLG